MPVPIRAMRTGCPLYVQQFQAILLKRWQMSIRSKFFFVAEMCTPAAFIVFLLLLNVRPMNVNESSLEVRLITPQKPHFCVEQCTYTCSRSCTYKYMRSFLNVPMQIHPWLFSQRFAGKIWPKPIDLDVFYSMHKPSGISHLDSINNLFEKSLLSSTHFGTRCTDPGIKYIFDSSYTY